jgi:amino acid adenylation domain-containing protein/non-ribosomal peptide synthase protein (TIGR01720 family)
MLKLNLLDHDNSKDLELVQIEETSTQDIAIIGYAGLLPHSEEIEDFWDHICHGRDFVNSFSEARIKDVSEYMNRLNLATPSITFYDGAYLEDIDKFDYKFFRLSPKEASLMSPSQRLFLETAWKAFEHAGYGGSKIHGTRTGIFLGHNSDSVHDYKRMIELLDPEALSLAAPGNLSSMIAGRIAYLLDLKGPSLCIDTACSSSLVAVHTACQALRQGECDMILAGSVKLNLLPLDQGIKLGIESSDCRAKTFDDSADGTGIGDGTIAVLLKPLNKAIQDRDHIHAVIKGSATNQDGSSAGITAPNALAQEEVIIRAWQDAGIEPESISHIEVHGTGTALGDPIEVDGITRAFRRYTEKNQFCAVSSLKSNIGHLDHAAGMASLLKSILSLKHKLLPPSVHFNRPNNKINFLESPIYVHNELMHWEANGGSRRCGISAFGMSGTNCHMVIEEAPELGEAPDIEEELNMENEGAHVFCLSAKNEQALRKYIDGYRKYISTGQTWSLADLCYTANTGRDHYEFRMIMLVNNKEELCVNILALSNMERWDPNELKNVYYSHGQIQHQEGAGNEELLSLCQAYIKGQDIDWHKQYQGEQRSRIPLPTYPFEKSRCWIGTNDKLDDSFARVNLTDESEREFTSTERKIAQIWGQILGYQQLHVKSNYYELGGDSIIALKVTRQIREQLGSQLDVADVLRLATIEQLSEYIDSAEPQQMDDQTRAVIPLAEINSYYPVSSAQRRLFIMHQVDLNNTIYNLPNTLHFKGELDVNKLEDVFIKLIERHEILRTSFEVIEGEIIQRIHEDVDFHIRMLRVDDKKAQRSIKQFVQPFDLRKPPLIRATLISKNRNEHILLIDVHHIVFDGTSTGIIISEMMELYKGNDIARLEIQYKDYAVWQQQVMKNGSLADQKQFWLNQLSGELPVLQLPTDFPRPPVKSFEGSTFEVTISKELTRKLRDIAQQNQATLYAVLLAGYYSFLARYTGQEDIIIGTPIAGRSHKGLDPLVGMFVNTLALRSYPQMNKEFTQFLNEVKDNTYHAYNHQDFPFEELVTMLDAGNRERNPLFDTMFIMQNMDMPDLSFENILCRHERYDQEGSKFDIMIQAQEKDQEIRLVVEFCTALFHQKTAETMIQHYIQLLTSIVENPQLRIAQLEMLSEDEKNQQLIDFNQTEAAYPEDKNLYQLFEEQMERTPNHIAVMSEESQLTYKELHIKASQLSSVLRKKGVGTNQIVAIMAERSTEMMIGIFAILKTGGAYLPIDPSYPKERISYLLNDSKAKILLSQEKWIEQHELPEAIDIIALEVDSVYGGVDHQEISSFKQSCAPKDLAYVMYTSGSTGHPKGVQIDHKSIISRIWWLQNAYPLNENDVILQKTPFTFDVSVTELFWWIVVGAKLYMLSPGGERDPQQMIATIAKNKVTMLNFVPTMLSTFMHYVEEMKVKEELSSLKYVVACGEALKSAQVNKFQQCIGSHHPTRLVNLYGPTEATIGVSHYECAGMYEGADTPIGKPIDNVQLYIFNKENALQPIGVAGELCISGVGLSVGYLNRAELTAEKFIDNPYHQGRRIYRTGDLARWLPDGNIEFLGRLDHQVKIRGYRIELGEVEAQLNTCKGINEAVVMVHETEQGSKELVGYYTVNRECTLSEIRNYLLKIIPEYMIPTYLIQLDEMPLTSNGKLNRQALPRPSGEQVERSEYMAPTNEIEAMVAEIWGEILNIKQVGIQDHFYELGGDSIKALQILFRLQSKGYQLEVRDIMQYSTIEELAPHVLVKNTESDQSPAEGEMHLSPIQHWYFEQKFQEPQHWNQSVLLYHPDGYDPIILQEVFQKLVQHHDSLRIRFRMEDGEVNAFYQDIENELFGLQVIEVNKEAQLREVIEQEANRVQESIDLENGPLVQLALFKTNEGDHLLIVIHHLVMDTVSWRILFEDFVTGYNQVQSFLPVQLPAKTDSYKKWTEELYRYANSKALLREWPYWRQMEESLVSKLPKDTLQTDNLQRNSRILTTELSREQTSQLLTQVHRAYNTEMNDILLTALGITLSQWMNSEDVLVNLEGHGREGISQDMNISRTIGWFTAQYPIILNLREKELGYLLKSIKEQLNKAPNKGIGYGLLNYLRDDEERQHMKFQLKPEISFNYLGQFDSDIQTEMFTISPYSSGQSMSPKGNRWVELEWNGLIRNGQLEVHLSYHSEAFTQETIRGLLDNYKQNLVDLIHHCLNQEKIEHTPSDYEEDEMSMEELDDLLGVIEGISDE